MGAIQLAPPDPILGISVAYKADTFEQKVDLGIGAYRTEEGNPYMFNAVRQAEEAVLSNTARNKEYQTIGGNAEFTTLSRQLVFGDLPEDKAKAIVSVQTLSGTGSLRVAAEFVG